MLIRIPADQDFGRTGWGALRATVGQRFALPQGRLRRTISLELLPGVRDKITDLILGHSSSFHLVLIDSSYSPNTTT